MVKSIGTKTLIEAIKAVENDEITYALFNKFKIEKDKSTVRVYQTSSSYNSFPADAKFVCYLETFEKSDLKPGMLVQTKSRDVYLVLNSECMICEDDYMTLDCYEDNLSHKNNANCDIIAIYKKQYSINVNLEDLMNLRFVDKIAEIKH